MIKLGSTNIKEVRLGNVKIPNAFIAEDVIIQGIKLLNQGFCPDYYSDLWTFKFDKNATLIIQSLNSSEIACEIYRDGTYQRMNKGTYRFEIGVLAGEEARILCTKFSGQAKAYVKY